MLRSGEIARREGLLLVNPLTEYTKALFLTISHAHGVDIRPEAIVGSRSQQTLVNAHLHLTLGLPLEPLS